MSVFAALREKVRDRRERFTEFTKRQNIEHVAILLSSGQRKPPYYITIAGTPEEMELLERFRPEHKVWIAGIDPPHSFWFEHENDYVLFKLMTHQRTPTE